MQINLVNILQTYLGFNLSIYLQQMNFCLLKYSSNNRTTCIPCWSLYLSFRKVLQAVGAVATACSSIYIGFVDTVAEASPTCKAESESRADCTQMGAQRTALHETLFSWTMQISISGWLLLICSKVHRVCCWLLEDEIPLGFLCYITKSRSWRLPGRGARKCICLFL